MSNVLHPQQFKAMIKADREAGIHTSHSSLSPSKNEVGFRKPYVPKHEKPKNN